MILGDNRTNWSPSMFSQSLSGCRVQFEFPIVKLLDYEAQWADLEASRNPFVIVTMAHLKTKTTRKGLERQRSLIFRLVTRRVGIVSKDLTESCSNSTHRSTRNLSGRFIGF